MFQVVTAAELAALQDGAGTEGSLGVFYQRRDNGSVSVWNPGRSAMQVVGPVLTYRKAGNLTTGVGADLVFSGAGAAGAGKLNTGVDLLIPANTLVAGTGQIRFNVNVRKTGTDTSFFVPRFGTTNGASDGSTGAAIQFTSANPQDLQLQCVLNASAGTLSLQGQYFVPGVTNGSGFTPADLGSLDFAVDNYLSFNISGATTGNYRITGYEVNVFQ